MYLQYGLLSPISNRPQRGYIGKELTGLERADNHQSEDNCNFGTDKQEPSELGGS